MLYPLYIVCVCVCVCVCERERERERGRERIYLGEKGICKCTTGISFCPIYFPSLKKGKKNRQWRSAYNFLVIILTLHFCSVCFNGKLYVKIVFHVFQCLLASEKMSQRKLFLIKIKSITYFLEIVFH